MEIIYRDIDNKIIAEQQLFSSFYTKEYRISGLLKRIDHFSGDDLSIEYYKDETESEIQIVNSLVDNNNLKKINIRSKSTHGKYTIYNENTYSRNPSSNTINNFPDSRTRRFLYDENNDQIASEGIDSTLPIIDPNYRRFGKSFHFFNTDYTEAERPYFVIRFNEDGSFDELKFNPNPELDESQDLEYYNEIQEAKDFMAAIGISSAMIDWYISDVFLPPI